MRKQLFTIAALLVATTAMGGGNLAQRLKAALHLGNELTMLVGTYTDTGSHGIYSLRFNQKTGEFTMLDSLRMINPSYLTLGSNGSTIYAVSELHNDNATVSAINLDKSTGHMTMASSTRTQGADPCYVETNGKLVLTANYTGGSMSVHGVNADGTLTALAQQFAGSTGGKHRNQRTSHVHTARFAGNGMVYATDFSADRILGFKAIDSQLQPTGVAGECEPSSGPRHIELSSDGRTLYTINELAGTVSVFARQGERLERIQTIASDSVGGQGCADIHLSGNGKFLYASNRLKSDGISIFKVDRDSGKLAKVGYQLTGAHPRNFIITPNGKFLLVACRDSNVIEVYAIDPSSGMLTPTPHSLKLKKPVCIKFDAKGKR